MPQQPKYGRKTQRPLMINVVRLHTGILLGSEKKNGELIHTVTLRKFENITLSKRSQKKTTYSMIPFI